MADFKPAYYNSLSPYLICKDAVGAIRFMEVVFGGKLLRRFDRPDGSLMHAEVRIDDTVLMIGGAMTKEQTSQPHLHLYVKDAAAVYARGLANGATSVQEPSRKNSEEDLRGGFRDTFGNTWWVATQ